MGRLESELRTSIRRTKINKAIIAAIAVAGVIAVGTMAPNILGALGRAGLVSQKKQGIKRSLTKLIKAGYVTLESGKAKLTPKGEKFAALLGEGKLAPKKPHKWDGKWRVLIFDIPEHRKRTRTQIRTTLVRLGFKRLQDSVWVYPYDCEDLTTLMKVDMKIGKDLLYMIVDKIEYDRPLRQYFDLTQ